MKLKSTHQAMLFVLWGVVVIGTCIAALFIHNPWFWGLTSLLMIHHLIFSGQVAEDVKAQMKREMDELDHLCSHSPDDDDWEDEDDEDEDDE